jgi:hypothetical protein
MALPDLQRAVATLAVALCAGAVVSAAAAEEPGTQVENGRDQARTLDVKPRDGKITPIVLPIPQSNPAIGTGLIGTGLLIYQPKGSDEPWTTGVAAFWFDSGSKGLGVFQEAHLKGDDIRLMALAGYADLHLDFFGVGPIAAARDLSIPLNEVGWAGIAQAAYRVKGKLYLGAKYRLIDLTTTIDTPEIPAPDLEPPAIQLQSRVSHLGAVALYDTRDSEFAPKKGVSARAEWLYGGEATGSDFNYFRITSEANYYRPVAGGVLAARGYFCNVGHEAPFYDVCLFGSGPDLKGYIGGQYRDYAMFAVQAEYRRHLFWKIGAVAFAGVGGVASRPGDLFDAKPLPSIGAGVRYLASKKYGVNIGADYAFGDGSSGLYLHIGESF